MSNTSRFTTVGFFILSLLLLAVKLSIAQTGKHNNKKLIVLNESARFPGCEIDELSIEKKVNCSQNKLNEYIRKHLQYPEIARNADFAPRIVQVQITVEADGHIHSPLVLNPDVQDYNQNAQRVFVKMAQDGIRWIPGKYEGRAMKSPVVVTVHFDWEGRKNSFSSLSHNLDVYEYVDEPPAFIICQQAGLKDREVMACVQQKMSEFFANHLEYPTDALELGIEGDIELEFIVGNDGIIKDVFLKNDIGFGCGQEAVRLVELMNEGDLVWLPGEEDGERVDVLQRATIQFRINPDQRMMSKLRTVDADKIFITEKEGFKKFRTANLLSPVKDDIDPCSQGVIDVRFKIMPYSEEITIVSMTDYNNLGKEFQSSVKSFLNATKGKWNNDLPNLSEATIYKLSLPFAANDHLCPSASNEYLDVVASALEVSTMVKDPETQNFGLNALDSAVKRFPADNKLRYLQGMALYQCNRRVEACVNLAYVKQQNKNIAVPSTCE